MLSSAVYESVYFLTLLGVLYIIFWIFADLFLYLEYLSISLVFLLQ